jgi:hypothetical protein
LVPHLFGFRPPKIKPQKTNKTMTIPALKDKAFSCKEEREKLKELGVRVSLSLFKPSSLGFIVLGRASACPSMVVDYRWYSFVWIVLLLDPQGF